MKLESVD
jgi:hypothetical protein